MRVLIVGEFSTCSEMDRLSNTDITDNGLIEDVICCENANLAMKQVQSGLAADLVICGTEVDMKSLHEQMVKQGIATPDMFQSRSGKTTIDASDFESVENHTARWHEASSWFGDENVPLRLGQSLVELEKAAILQTLAHCGGNRTYAADILGISSRTLRSKLQQYTAEGCAEIAPPVRRPSGSAYSAMSGKLLS